jgi:hypothetical protein
MDDHATAALLRKICMDGPQRLSASIRLAADALIEKGLASLVNRGSHVGATTRGYEKHKAPVEHS